MASSGQTPEFLSPDKKTAREPRSMAPWIIAGIVVLLILGIFLARSHHASQANSAAAAPAQPDPYAANLALSNYQMSEASSVAGGKSIYLDGLIANHGNRTVSGINVQVAFHDFTGQFARNQAMPLNLIRTHQPYIDTRSVSAAPIAPGETREFRLIFDNVPENWNQNYPDIRVIEVKFK